MDALEWMATLPDSSVHAIITDLPYQVTNCSWDTIIPFAPMWEQVKRVLKPRGMFVTTASQPFTSALVMSNLEWFRYEWVWKKSKATGHLDAERKPLKAHESIVVFAEGATVYNPQMTRGARHHRGQRAQSKPTQVYGKFTFSLYYSDDYYPQSVLDINVQEQAIHPTQKPVALYAYLIRTYTNPGDVVVDPCCGSGTTGVACIKESRDFRGNDSDAGYIAIATRRLQDAAAQPMLFALDA